MKILFINPICTRNGATFMLLYFLQELKRNNSEIEFDIISLRGGELEKEFDNLNVNHFKLFNKKQIPFRFIRLIMRKLKFIKLISDCIYDYEIRNISKIKYDIIYNNTIFNLPVAVMFKVFLPNTKLILHVHELQNFILTTSPNIDRYFPKVDHFICASKAVENNLIKNWGIEKSTVIYELSNIKKVNNFKIIKNKIVISGAGGVTHRKGVDLFIEAANYIYVNNKNLEINFQWLGNISEDDLAVYQYQIKKYNSDFTVKFLGEKSDTSFFFEETDIFIMSSREDPFPLVCIEAGNNAIPIFLFDKATGTQEVLQDLEYLVAPQFDTKILADKISNLINDKNLYAVTSKLMNERFSEFNVENQSRKIVNLLKSFV